MLHVATDTKHPFFLHASPTRHDYRALWGSSAIGGSCGLTRCFRALVVLLSRRTRGVWAHSSGLLWRRSSAISPRTPWNHPWRSAGCSCWLPQRTRWYIDLCLCMRAFWLRNWFCVHGGNARRMNHWVSQFRPCCLAADVLKMRGALL